MMLKKHQDILSNFIKRIKKIFLIEIVDKNGKHNKEAEVKLKKESDADFKKLFDKFEDELTSNDDFIYYDDDYELPLVCEMELEELKYVYNEQKNEYCAICTVYFNFIWRHYTQDYDYEDEETLSSSDFYFSNLYEIGLSIKFDKYFNVDDIDLYLTYDKKYKKDTPGYRSDLEELKRMFKKDQNMSKLIKYVYDNMVNADYIPVKYQFDEYVVNDVN